MEVAKIILAISTLFYHSIKHNQPKFAKYMDNSLKDLITRNEVSPKILALLQRQLLDELLNLETEYTLTPEHIIISEDRRKIWLDNFPQYSGNEEDSVPNYRQLIK